MLPDPAELGNEDEEAGRLSRFSLCLCGHPEVADHPGGMCVRPLCGCYRFRPDPRAAAA